MKNHRAFFPLALLFALVMAGCSSIPIPIPFIGSTPVPTSPANVLVYDMPTSLTIRNGAVLPGTTIGYGGKTQTGAAKVLIAGLVAAKQVGDTLDWQGTPVPNTNVKISTRVFSFDDQSIGLVGTAHIEISGAVIQPGIASTTSGGTATPSGLEFSGPATYSVAKGSMIPGTNITYLGATNDGAQFGGIEGYPYRKELDSLQYLGRLNSKVTLKLDLRVLNISGASALVGGTADLKIAIP